MVSWYATEYWSAGELVSSFFKWANTDSWTVSSETPNFDATYMEIKVYSYWMTSIECTILNLLSWTYFVTCFLIHYFFIWFFSWIRKQIFWQVDLKIHVWLSLYKDHFKKTYLEPWMLYDITDGRSFHCIDLEHLSDQVCYWRIFNMFWCFVNSSFDLQK